MVVHTVRGCLRSVTDNAAYDPRQSSSILLYFYLQLIVVFHFSSPFQLKWSILKFWAALPRSWRVCIVLFFTIVKDMANEYGHRERRVRRRIGGDSEDDQTSRDCEDE